MIDITVGTIKENIHAHIDDMMADIQTAEGIKNGDVEPLELLFLDNKVEELAIVIWNLLFKQSNQN